MNKEKFEELKKTLFDRGYKQYDQCWHHEDYVLCKGFHKEDNQWEENRNVYQIIISVYNWSNPEKPYYARLPKDMLEKVGLEVHIEMSRIIDERLDLTLCWKDSDTIEEIERIAEEYYKAMCNIVPKPRED